MSWFKSLELVAWQRGIKVTDEMKVTKAWIRQVVQSQPQGSYKVGQRDAMLWLWRWRVGVMSQGMLEAFTSFINLVKKYHQHLPTSVSSAMRKNPHPLRAVFTRYWQWGHPSLGPSCNRPLSFHAWGPSIGWECHLKLGSWHKHAQ